MRSVCWLVRLCCSKSHMTFFDAHGGIYSANAFPSPIIQDKNHLKQANKRFCTATNLLWKTKQKTMVVLSVVYSEHVHQRSQTQFLEGHSSAEFSFNQLQLTPVWKLLVILKTLISWIRCVWLGLELNSSELWPSRNWVWDHWCTRSTRRAETFTALMT